MALSSFDILNEVQTIILDALIGGNTEPFGNMGGFELNQTCIMLIVIFIVLFMYKEDVMNLIK